MKNSYKSSVPLTELMPGLPECIKNNLLETMTSEDIREANVKRVSVVSVAKISGDRQIKITVTTRDMDRDMEIVVPKGGDLKEFRAGGKILDSHNYWSLSAIIGKPVEISVDDKQIDMVIEFAPTPEGDRAFALAKFMPMTASIGFITIESINNRNQDFEKTVGKFEKVWPELAKTKDNLRRIITKWMMLEVSIVSVPSNAAALQTQVSKELKAGHMTPEDAELCVKAYKAIDEAAPVEKAEDVEDPEKPADPPQETPDPEDEPDPAKAARVVSTGVKVVSAPKVVEKGRDVTDTVKNVLALKSGKV